MVLYMYMVRNKSVIRSAWCNIGSNCVLSFTVFHNIFELYYGTPLAPKNQMNVFYLKIKKSENQKKCIFMFFFYQILKFYKYWFKNLEDMQNKLYWLKDNGFWEFSMIQY